MDFTYGIKYGFCPNSNVIIPEKTVCGTMQMCDDCEQFFKGYEIGQKYVNNTILNFIKNKYSEEYIENNKKLKQLSDLCKGIKK